MLKFVETACECARGSRVCDDCAGLDFGFFSSNFLESFSFFRKILKVFVPNFLSGMGSLVSAAPSSGEGERKAENISDMVSCGVL